MNTIKRRDEQINTALTFLSKSDFTSAKNLQLVVGRNRRGFPTQLLSLGLILSRETFRGQYIYGLSQKGANLIGSKKIDIHKVGLSRIEHALIAQFETISSIEGFRIDDYEFEPQQYSRDTRPDACWDTPQGRYYIEIELSAKSLADGDLDRFFLKLICRRTIVVFREPSLADRYLEHARKYAKHGIPNWQKLVGEWVKFSDFIPVTCEQWDRIIFKLVNEPAKHTLAEMIG